MSTIIAPSILSADFAHLADEVKKVTEAGAEYIHIDVMDGTFVPEITIGAGVVKSLRKVTDAVLDVHLMVEHPETHVESFAAAGADIITFHVEATRHAHRLIQKIHELGCKAGVALNPGTSLSAIEELVEDADMILIMTVNPGYGGQKFIESQLGKIHMLYHMIDEMETECDIEVDGGINAETSEAVREMGANVLVAGSAIYGAEDVAQAVKDIRGKEIVHHHHHDEDEDDVEEF
ncbi:MAG: ribulose-phosphate 3-epimerase [Selenomonadaceae bacterium]|nr:ribulose-phosphate 3-epimerase [Selenomonadaceae bacterium]